MVLRQDSRLQGHLGKHIHQLTLLRSMDEPLFTVGSLDPGSNLPYKLSKKSVMIHEPLFYFNLYLNPVNLSVRVKWRSSTESGNFGHV